MEVKKEVKVEEIPAKHNSQHEVLNSLLKA